MLEIALKVQLVAVRVIGAEVREEKKLACVYESLWCAGGVREERLLLLKVMVGIEGAGNGLVESSVTEKRDCPKTM